MSAKEKLLAFIRHAGEVLGYDELADADLDIDVNRVEDPDYPFYCTDLAREETGEVFRFCLLENPATLEETLEYYFARYRELEEDYGDEFNGAVLLLRTDSPDDQDFFYIYRTDSGEVGLFHSELSIDDLDDAEEADEDEDENEAPGQANGRREVDGL